jgi:hypothetical protein
MTQPGEPGDLGPQATTDLSNPEQHDSAAPEPDQKEPAVTEPEQDPRSRAAELEAELARIRSAAVTGLKVLLRVGKPHVSMTYGGITVTDQPTEVPARHVPALQEAAANAGVDLIQEEG